MRHELMVRLLAFLCAFVALPAFGADIVAQWGVARIIQFRLYDPATNAPITDAADDGDDLHVDLDCDGTSSSSSDDFGQIEHNLYEFSATSAELRAPTICLLVDSDSDDTVDEVIVIETYGCHEGAATHFVGISRCGFVQSVDGLEIVLDAGADSAALFYDLASLRIIDGTGAGQHRYIRPGYNGGSLTATVDRAWVVEPDTTSLYQILTDSMGADVRFMNGAEVCGDGDITPWNGSCD